MISACQTSPTAIMLIATRQTAMTNVLCVSEAGMRRQRVIQAMVRGLLVLGRYAVGTTRELPADAISASRQEYGQLKGQSQHESTSAPRLPKSTVSEN